MRSASESDWSRTSRTRLSSQARRRKSVEARTAKAEDAPSTSCAQTFIKFSRHKLFDPDLLAINSADGTSDRVAARPRLDRIATAGSGLTDTFMPIARGPSGGQRGKGRGAWHGGSRCRTTSLPRIAIPRPMDAKSPGISSSAGRPRSGRRTSGSVGMRCHSKSPRYHKCQSSSAKAIGPDTAPISSPPSPIAVLLLALRRKSSNLS